MNQDIQDVLSRLGHFGYIPPSQRPADQQALHAKNLAARPPFTLVRKDVPVGTKIMLTDLWKDPLIVADIGQPFTGFYQFTGSCVGVSTGNAIATVSFVQRKFAANPTKAFVPWWPYAYGTCRYNEGDRGQGEGAIDSEMFKTLENNGCLDSTENGLPKYSITNDGYQLSQSLEMKYSDGASSLNTMWATVAKKFPLGSAATLNNTNDIAAAIQNGYPVLDGCDDYIGNGSVDSNGVCLGTYDGRGGHSTCYLGYWNHTNLGPLFLYSNQWASDTYPDDSSGKGRCTVWVKEANVARLFSLGGSGGETAALSHLAYLPAQPNIVDAFV